MTIERVHRPAPVGVLRDAPRAWRPGARRGRRTGRPAGSRGSPPDVPAARVGGEWAARGPLRPSTRRTATSSWGSKTTACAGRLGRSPAELDRRVVLRRRRRARWSPRARRGRPSPSPPPPGRTPSRGSGPRRGRPRRTSGSRAIAARGAGTVDRRPVDAREGVEARERVEDRARGRQHVVERAQDRRALDVVRAGRAPGASAATTAPASHARPSATPVLSTAPASPSTTPSAGPVMRRRRPIAQSLERRAEEHPADERARRGRRAARRATAIPPTPARVPRRAPRKSAGGEAGERRRADDEALEVAGGRPSMSVSATMIQSSAVTKGRAGYPPPGLGNAAEVSRGARPGERPAAANGVGKTLTPSAGASLAGARSAPDRRAGGVRAGLRRRPRPRRPPQAGRQQHVERFARAWERGDYAAMYAELTATPATRVAPGALHPPPTTTPMRTATAAEGRHRPGRARTATPSRAASASATRVFGTVAGERRPAPPPSDGDRLARALVFPGPARPASGSRRATTMPARADLLARDGTVLAKGDDRSSPSLLARRRSSASSGPIPPERREELARARGTGRRARSASSGLERIFDERLLGTPRRRAASPARACSRDRAPRQAPAVRTTISPPRSSRRPSPRSAAASAASWRSQPAHRRDPGLRRDRLLRAAAARIDVQDHHGDRRRSRRGSPTRRRPIPVAARRPCSRASTSRTPTASPAAARSSPPSPSRATRSSRRWAPSWAPSGSSPPPRRFGFNEPPGHPGRGRRARSRRPARSATTWRSARRPSARAACRRRRCRWRPSRRRSACAGAGRSLTLDCDAAHGRAADPRAPRAAKVARTVRAPHAARSCAAAPARAAAIPGVRVAGKTGTAELRTTKRACPTPTQPGDLPARATRPTTRPTPTRGSRPTRRPATAAAHVAVGVLLVGSGAGGDTAAPAARDVLLAGLKATG